MTAPNCTRKSRTPVRSRPLSRHDPAGHGSRFRTVPMASRRRRADGRHPDDDAVRPLVGGCADRDHVRCLMGDFHDDRICDTRLRSDPQAGRTFLDRASGKPGPGRTPAGRPRRERAEIAGSLVPFGFRLLFDFSFVFQIPSGTSGADSAAAISMTSMV